MVFSCSCNMFQCGSAAFVAQGGQSIFSAATGFCSQCSSGHRPLFPHCFNAHRALFPGHFLFCIKIQITGYRTCLTFRMAWPPGARTSGHRRVPRVREPGGRDYFKQRIGTRIMGTMRNADAYDNSRCHNHYKNRGSPCGER